MSEVGSSRTTDASVQRESLLEERIAQLSDELAAARQELRDRVELLGHDLRQPIAALTIWVQLLRSHHASDLDENGRQLLGEIVRAVDCVADLVTPRHPRAASDSPRRESAETKSRPAGSRSERDPVSRPRAPSN